MRYDKNTINRTFRCLVKNLLCTLVYPDRFELIAEGLNIGLILIRLYSIFLTKTENCFYHRHLMAGLM